MESEEGFFSLVFVTCFVSPFDATPQFLQKLTPFNHYVFLGVCVCCYVDLSIDFSVFWKTCAVDGYMPSLLSTIFKYSVYCKKLSTRKHEGNMCSLA